MKDISSLNPSNEPIALAIVGGGLTGLILAAGLCSRGIKAHVYEAKPDFIEISAGIGLSPNAYRALKLVSEAAFAAFDGIRTRNASLETRNTWFNFRLGMREDLGFLGSVHLNGEQTGNVHRGRLLGELVKLLPEGGATLDKTVVGIRNMDEEADTKLKLEFSDGSYELADAVLGCDGIHSEVRKIIFGDTPDTNPVFSGVYCYRGLVEMDEAIAAVGEGLARDSQVYMGQGGDIVTYPINEGRTLNVVAFRKHPEMHWEADRWVATVPPDQLLKDFRGWASPLLALLKMVGATSIWAIHDMPPLKSYVRNRVVLLGDAAHASTSHSGAGAGIGVEDALVLCELLQDERIRSATVLPSVFQAFDKMRHSRTQNLVQYSRNLGAMFQLRGKGVEGDLEKLHSHLSTLNQWIWDFDVEEHVRQAHEALTKELTHNTLS